MYMTVDSSTTVLQVSYLLGPASTFRNTVDTTFHLEIAVRP